jgi:hypothetical protein
LVAAQGTDAVHAQPNRCSTTPRAVLSGREDAAAATGGTADQSRDRTAAPTAIALDHDGGYAVEQPTEADVCAPNKALSRRFTELFCSGDETRRNGPRAYLFRKLRGIES